MGNKNGVDRKHYWSSKLQRGKSDKSGKSGISDSRMTSAEAQERSDLFHDGTTHAASAVGAQSVDGEESLHNAPSNMNEASNNASVNGAELSLYSSLGGDDCVHNASVDGEENPLNMNETSNNDASVDRQESTQNALHHHIAYADENVHNAFLNQYKTSFDESFQGGEAPAGTLLNSDENGQNALLNIGHAEDENFRMKEAMFLETAGKGDTHYNIALQFETAGEARNLDTEQAVTDFSKDNIENNNSLAKSRILHEHVCENGSTLTIKPVAVRRQKGRSNNGLEFLEGDLANVKEIRQKETFTDDLLKNRHDFHNVAKEEKSPSDLKNMLIKLMGLLNPSSLDWLSTLSQISKILRSCSLENEQREITQCLIEFKFINRLEMFLEMNDLYSFLELKSNKKLQTEIWPTVKRYLTIVWVSCDRNVNFCQNVLNSKVFIFLMSELRTLSTISYAHCDMTLFIIKAILGILHNIARHVPNSKWNLRNEGLVTILRTFLPSEVPMVRVKSLIVLSYILSEAENEMINSDDDVFVFIFEVLSDALKSANHQSSKYGMSVTEVLKGVNNLAINDENKLRIVRNGALPLFQEVLIGGLSEEKKWMIMTLWSLAFHHYNKRKIREMAGIMGKLYELQQRGDEEICHAARGTFWELENISKTTITKSYSSSTGKDVNQPHIMISYQWDSQPIMLKVKDRLKHAGYKVWMDVEHMTGSTLEAMALAVEKAAVVLVCMSQKYKNSPNCRTEAEYVYRLQKDFVPLRLQQEYVPDGWLGILVGTRLYFDMYPEEVLDSQLPRLIKELQDRGKISLSSDIPDYGPVVPQRMLSREAVPLLQHTADTEVANWSSHDINDWLMSLGLADIQDRLLGIDGPLLLEMQKIQKTAPEYFYNMLSHDLGLSTVMVLKLSKALRCLR